MPREGPAGHREFHRIYQIFPISQTGRRPYVSDSGAIITGAKLNPRKKIEKITCPVVLLTCSSRLMSPKAGAIIEADMVVIS